jgi:hypothetical protein
MEHDGFEAIGPGDTAANVICRIDEKHSMANCSMFVFEKVMPLMSRAHYARTVFRSSSSPAFPMTRCQRN